MVVSQGRIVRVDRTASTESRPATSLQLASDDRRDISSHSAVGDRVCDLGDVAILPALVNAHTHLEFSDLDSPVGQPGMELAEWIVHVVRARQAAAEAAGGAVASPQLIVTRGASEAIEGGTALIGEIASTPWPGIDRGHARRGEVVAFAEVLGLTKERGEAKFGLAGEHLDSFGELAGVSPHAPYSTPLELIERCVKLSGDRACPLAMHVAESPAERELLHSGTGPFAESLGRLGIDLSGLFPWPHAQPVKVLIERLAKASSSLLVHGNDLQRSEIDLLSRSPAVSVVYCPRTHAFFQHHRHPVADLIAAGVNVALGTDSRASNPDLQLWREVRFLLEHRQDLDPANVLQMATLNGARAMRLDHRFGTISAGRDAVFARVPSTARTVDQLYADFACFDASSADALHS